VRLNRRPAKPSSPVGAGDAVECRPPPQPLDTGLEPEPGDLDVLYEDADLVAVAKTPGVVVHPGAGRDRGTLAHFLLDRFPDIAGVGGRGRPGIVHRLDKDTSGVMVVARNETAYLRLQRAFAARDVAKTYLAIAYGVPRAASGEIDLPIGRHRRERKRMDVRRRGGRPALSRFRCRGSGGGVSLFEIELMTGRTHQIRVHLKAVGHPLVGDPVYGEKRWRSLEPAVRRPLSRFPRPALHAWRLAFAHPVTGEAMAFEAPVPEDLRQLWREVTGGEWPL
jgi:23S rRNA pseudouridine1911/1915/1917 synthase